MYACLVLCGLSGGSLPSVGSQGVKTMLCDKNGFTKCCGNLEQLVFPGGVEEACLLEGDFCAAFWSDDE